MDSKELLAPYSFSSDGKLLSVVQVVNRQIEIVPVEQQGDELKPGVRQVLVAGPSVNLPVLSPDGKWLAYTSAESGPTEVYVRSASASQSGRWQISNNGGNLPRWSRDGRALVYQSGDRLMSASYSVQGDTFVPGTSRVWIDKLGTEEQWDLAPDDKRVIAIVPVEEQQAPQADHEITILFNFFDELKRKVPVP